MLRIHWLKPLSHAAALAVILVAMTGCSESYTNPPASLQETDILGTWQARYDLGAARGGVGHWGTDTLVIGENGRFKQEFYDLNVEADSYETSWNQWFLERLPDGRVRLHLEGARYYRKGTKQAEQEGLDMDLPTDTACPKGDPHCWRASKPHAFWDPIAKESLTMRGELVLNVQTTEAGELVLLQMLYSANDSFIITSGGGAVGFRRLPAGR